MDISRNIQFSGMHNEVNVQLAAMKITCIKLDVRSGRREAKMVEAIREAILVLLILALLGAAGYGGYRAYQRFWPW